LVLPETICSWLGSDLVLKDIRVTKYLPGHHHHQWQTHLHTILHN